MVIYYGLRTFLLLAWRVILRYIKMSVRNQLTHYELEEFFRSLQDLLVLSLNPSLSFDSAEFLSWRLDGFKRTLSILSSRLPVHVSYWSEVQLLSDLDTLLFIVSHQRQHCEDLSYFALHAEEEIQLLYAVLPTNLLKYRASIGRPGTPDLTTPTLVVESKVSPRNVAFVDWQ